MSKKRLLIVDDEDAFTRLLRLTLEGTGRYIVEEVNDGTKAAEVARYFKPDMIFLDVVMPGIDGGDVATRLKSDSELAGIPIVFLTAIVSQKEAKALSQIGGYPFLAKPISVETIEKCVAEHARK